MYRGFNLRLPDDYFDDFIETGRASFEGQRTGLDTTISDCVKRDGVLDGGFLRKKWFPGIDCQVFISHSHRDEDLAIGFAGWLEVEFGISAFVDSCIWGYADELLHMLDQRYCRSSSGSTFDYEKRNRSTAHVHALLSTALVHMIDRTECLVFLNTPRSTKVHGVVQSTYSPWIYTEIEVSRTIRREKQKRPGQLFKGTGLLKEASFGRLVMDFDLGLEHLAKIDADHMVAWTNRGKALWGPDSLDALYTLVPDPAQK